MVGFLLMLKVGFPEGVGSDGRVSIKEYNITPLYLKGRKKEKG